MIEKVKENKEDITHSQKIICPTCGIKQFSPFDKLFTVAYGQCYICTPDDAEKNDLIFSIIEN